MCVLLVAWTTLATASPPSASSAAVEDAILFLKRFAATVTIGERAPLYTDDAHIYLTVDDHPATLDGRAWQRALRSMPAGTDPFELHDVQITRDRDTWHIAARRYARARCSWDPNYALTLVGTANALRIAEEHLALVRASQCSPQPTAASPAHRWTASADIRVTPIAGPNPSLANTESVDLNDSDNSLPTTLDAAARQVEASLRLAERLAAAHPASNTNTSTVASRQPVIAPPPPATPERPNPLVVTPN